MPPERTPSDRIFDLLVERPFERMGNLQISALLHHDDPSDIYRIACTDPRIKREYNPKQNQMEFYVEPF